MNFYLGIDFAARHPAGIDMCPSACAHGTGHFTYDGMVSVLRRVLSLHISRVQRRPSAKSNFHIAFREGDEREGCIGSIAAHTQCGTGDAAAEWEMYCCGGVVNSGLVK